MGDFWSIVQEKFVKKNVKGRTKRQRVAGMCVLEAQTYFGRMDQAVGKLSECKVEDKEINVYTGRKQRSEVVIKRRDDEGHKETPK